MFGAIRKHLLHRKKRLTAKLSGVAGHTGGGAFDYIRFPEGFAAYEVNLHGVAGTRAVVVLDGVEIAEIAIENGRAIFSGDTRRTGVALIALSGDKIEIRQHGVVILQGKLHNARRLYRAVMSLLRLH